MAVKSKAIQGKAVNYENLYTLQSLPMLIKLEICSLSPILGLCTSIFCVQLADSYQRLFERNVKLDYQVEMLTAISMLGANENRINRALAKRDATAFYTNKTKNASVHRSWLYCV